MTPEDFKAWDWMRIWVGEVPVAFLAETVLRVVILYVLLLSSMRLLGKRIATQLTRNELAAMVSLAAAIGAPLLAPDRGLIPPLVIAFIVVAVSRLVAILASRNAQIEVITQGSIQTLLSSATLNIKGMTKSKISRERIFAQLRSESLYHLGQVDRLYIEANGSFTLVKATKERPGLSIIPENDPEFLEILDKADNHVCKYCGKEGDRHNNNQCLNCRHNEWTHSVTTGK